MGPHGPQQLAHYEACRQYLVEEARAATARAPTEARRAEPGSTVRASLAHRARQVAGLALIRTGRWLAVVGGAIRADHPEPAP